MIATARRQISAASDSRPGIRSITPPTRQHDTTTSNCQPALSGSLVANLTSASVTSSRRALPMAVARPGEYRLRVRDRLNRAGTLSVRVSAQ